MAGRQKILQFVDSLSPEQFVELVGEFRHRLEEAERLTALLAERDATIEQQQATIDQLTSAMNDVGMVVQSLSVTRDHASDSLGDAHAFVQEIDGVIRQVNESAMSVMSIAASRRAHHA